MRFPGLEKLTPAHTASMAKLIIGNHHSATESLEKSGSADLSFSAPGEARFRVNIFQQRGTHAIVMRVIPSNPPNFNDDGSRRGMTQEGALPYATNANNLLLRLGDLGGQALVLKAPATSLDDDTMLDMIER